MRLHLILCLCLCLCIFGCSSIQQLTNGGEPAAKDDATPPIGYDPHYIKQIRELPPDPHEPPGARMELSHIDAREINRVKVYADYVDTSGNYWGGASKGKWKSKWCYVSDKSGNDSITIKKYKLNEVTEMERIPTAIALVMDHSGSMGEERAHVVQNAAERLINRKKDEDAISLIKYDNHVNVDADLTTDAGVLRQKLAKTGLDGYGGCTAIVNAVGTGVEQLKSATNYERRAVVLFTDGQDNSSTMSKDSVLHFARKNGIMVCSMGFGDGINEPFLLSITNPTGGIYEHIYRTNEIDDAFEDLYHRLRNYCTFEYAPPSYGKHTVTIGLCLPEGTLSAHGEYENTPDVGDVSLLDINFELDRSDLPQTSHDAIVSMQDMMKAFPMMVIEVRGHTDSTNKTGDTDHNKKLSQKRADAVRAALVKTGVKPERVKANGYGDAMPIASNETEEGRAKNRRTEFIVVTK